MKRALFSLVLFLLLFHLSFAQQYRSFTDSRDGKVYKTVKIGEQIWMAENLNVERFRNGDPILEAKTQEEWCRATNEGTPAWCYYANEKVNGLKYGKLYNWYAVNDPRGLAPEDWHIPSTQEWHKLLQLFANDTLPSMLLSKKGWKEFKNRNSENSLPIIFSFMTDTLLIMSKSERAGFEAKPGGYRSEGSDFLHIGILANWWTSTSYKLDVNPNLESVVSYSLISTENLPKEDSVNKGNGFSVRCIQNHRR